MPQVTSHVVWLPEAVSDLDRLLNFLKDKNTQAAQRAAHLILSGAEALQKHPLMGKLMGDETGRRELFLSFGQSAYVLRYKIDNTSVVIIRVWHRREARD